jgi:hypothetical protein
MASLRKVLIDLLVGGAATETFVSKLNKLSRLLIKAVQRFVTAETA